GPGPSYEILTIADTEPSTKAKATGRKKQLDEAKLRADIKAGRAAGQTRREAFFAAYLAQNFSEAQATEAWNDLYGDD
ncbi:MAG: hypothetical protein KGR26_13820, partial [Cyanobacteria bacterium REEB65]|nr:hypothetical protein [Cyanobacteria bacterium REEB65]